jgi:hypothetical protein
MDIGINGAILAVVTTDSAKVLNSSVPVFFAEDEQEREKVAMLLSRITKGMVHDLENGCFIIVRH